MIHATMIKIDFSLVRDLSKATVLFAYKSIAIKNGALWSIL